MEIRNFCGEAIGDVKRVAPAGAPPIWKTFAAIGTKRRDAFPELAGVLRDALTDLFGAIHIDKFSVSAVSDAVGEPAMDPLSGRNCPGIAVAIVWRDTEKNFHPNDGRPAQRLLPLGDAQRFFLIGWTPKREFIFARRAQLSARIECVPRPANANRVDFLCVHWGPILQPIAGLLFQRMECLLRNAPSVCVEVKPGKKFARVRDSTRRCFRIQARAHAEACANRFHEVEKLSPTNLSLFIWTEKQRLPFAHAPVTFALPAAFRRAPIQCRILSIKLLNLLVPDEGKLVVECWPCFIV